MKPCSGRRGKSAAPIFIDAIKKMSIQDALGILQGSDVAATDI